MAVVLRIFVSLFMGISLVFWSQMFIILLNVHSGAGFSLMQVECPYLDEP